MKIEIPFAYLVRIGYDDHVQCYTLEFEVSNDTIDSINRLDIALEEFSNGEPVKLIIKREI